MPASVRDASVRSVIRRAFITWATIVVGIAIAAAVVPGIEIHGGFMTLLWVALLFGLVNAVLGPLLRLFSLPLTVLTLGLFALVVNGILLAITAGISDNLDVGGFVAAIVGALIISVVTAVLSFVIRPVARPRR